MADQQDIALDTLLADPARVVGMVERDHVTVRVVRDDELVLVMSPAPIAEKMTEIHRTLEEGSRDQSFYLDVMDTRRLLGL
jgi:hypothetical protein